MIRGRQGERGREEEREKEREECIFGWVLVGFSDCHKWLKPKVIKAKLGMYPCADEAPQPITVITRALCCVCVCV